MGGLELLRQLSADQFQRVVGDNPLFVGRDNQGLGRTSLGDLATLAETSLQVGVVIDVKAQQTQLVQGDFTDRAEFSPIPPVKTTASRRPSMAAA